MNIVTTCIESHNLQHINERCKALNENGWERVGRLLVHKSAYGFKTRYCQIIFKHQRSLNQGDE